MAREPPNLLTLPREIRNEIYKYLTREYSVKSVLTTKSPRTRRYTTCLQIDDGPLLNVLLVHSGIHAEYLKSGCFNNLSATISSTQYYFSTAHERQDAMTTQKAELLEALLHRVKRLTIRMHHSVGTTGNTVLAKITDFLASRVPRLRSVRVAVHMKTGRDSFDTSQYALLPWSFRTYPGLDSDLLGMPVVQRGTCYHAYLATESVLAPAPPHLLEHWIDQINFGLYTLDKPATLFWTSRDIVGNKTPRKYPEHILAAMPEEEAKKLIDLPKQALMWKEQRGDEIKDCSK